MPPPKFTDRRLLNESVEHEGGGKQHTLAASIVRGGGLFKKKKRTRYVYKTQKKLKVEIHV